MGPWFVNHWIMAKENKLIAEIWQMPVNASFRAEQCNIHAIYELKLLKWSSGN